MLSLIRPSSSPCLHQHPESFAASVSASLGTAAATPAPIASHASAFSSSSNSKTNSKNSPSIALTVATTSSTAAAGTRPPLKSSASAPLNNAASYKELVAQFTAKAPQPYGVIPPRKKRAPGLVRSSSTSSITTKSSKISKSTSSLPPSPTETSHNAVELQPRSLSRKSGSGSKNSGNPVQTQIIQPLLHSLQSLLPESTTSDSRLGFWANLKAHYLAATATTLSWASSSSSNGQSPATKEFSPPVALRLSNGTPVAAVDATTPPSASLTLTDGLLSLPNLATPSTHVYHGSVNFPVSVAAMDKFKAIPSDTIPLRTFTYHETPVVERPQPLPLPPSKRKTAQSSKTTTRTLSLSSPVTKNSKDAVSGDKEASLPPPLPRHLATRETRSNTDYLRMMAAELRMIRARKLVSPLKPRGYLPRRKDSFRRVKSSLCNFLEMPREEDDHPLNDIMVGSWSSVSSTDSFLSTASSEYRSASENFY